ncbi:hypothetical protein BB559_000951 [Furculomyces boomerangus]|uniref:Uncharacterized protein n=1 Tax=Furculomyces boomerangus TaxID=61424 RepID=A0A2T9Z3L6_9FUNG|nr:hypothetical protein BB559_000951 [Furculomyces boomerangus]
MSNQSKGFWIFDKIGAFFEKARESALKGSIAVHNNVAPAELKSFEIGKRTNPFPESSKIIKKPKHVREGIKPATVLSLSTEDNSKRMLESLRQDQNEYELEAKILKTIEPRTPTKPRKVLIAHAQNSSNKKGKVDSFLKENYLESRIQTHKINSPKTFADSRESSTTLEFSKSSGNNYEELRKREDRKKPMKDYFSSDMAKKLDVLEKELTDLRKVVASLCPNGTIPSDVQKNILYNTDGSGKDTLVSPSLNDFGILNYNGVINSIEETNLDVCTPTKNFNTSGPPLPPPPPPVNFLLGANCKQHDNKENIVHKKPNDDSNNQLPPHVISRELLLSLKSNLRNTKEAQRSPVKQGLLGSNMTEIGENGEISPKSKMIKKNPLMTQLLQEMQTHKLKETKLLKKII